MKIKIQFFTYWHCGAGSSGGASVDALVVKDKQGMPYVPGRTLKGLAREMAETLNDSTHFVDKCFGKKSTEDGDNTGREEGECYFHNAVLKEDIDPKLASYLYHSIASTKIDADGLASTGSLREIEVVVPLTLYATVDNCPEMYKSNMEKSLNQVKRIGLNRNRGLGSCEIIVKEQS